MTVEIRETTITPTQNGLVVQLYISDAAREDESATFVLELQTLLPRIEDPSM